MTQQPCDPSHAALLVRECAGIAGSNVPERVAVPAEASACAGTTTHAGVKKLRLESHPAAHAAKTGATALSSSCPSRSCTAGGTLLAMKTVVSVPDGTFERVTRHARALGITTSEFFARAAEHYLDELDGKSLTERMNAALEQIGETDTSNGAAAAGRARLTKTSNEW